MPGSAKEAIRVKFSIKYDEQKTIPLLKTVFINNAATCVASLHKTAVYKPSIVASFSEDILLRDLPIHGDLKIAQIPSDINNVS